MGISELDIYRAAGVRVREHGAQAPAHVAARMVKLAGDTEGRAVWERIGPAPSLSKDRAKAAGCSRPAARRQKKRAR